MANEAKIVISAEDRTASAFSKTNQGLISISTQLDAVKGSVRSFGELLAGGYVVSRLVGFAKANIDAADALNDLSTRTGVSADRLAAWKLIADQSGSSIEDLAGALGKAAKYMVSHGDNLEKLGIHAKTAEEVIIQLSGVIASMPADDPRRVALAMEVLGKSAGALVPLMSEGEAKMRSLLGRSKEYAGDLPEFAKRSDRFNDSLSVMRAQMSLGASVLLNDLLPSLTKFMEVLTNTRGPSELGADLFNELLETNKKIQRMKDDKKGNTGDFDRNYDGMFIREKDIARLEKYADQVSVRLKKANSEAAKIRALYGKEPTAPKAGIVESIIGGDEAGKKIASFSDAVSNAYAKAVLGAKSESDALQRKLDATDKIIPSQRIYLQGMIDEIRSSEDIVKTQSKMATFGGALSAAMEPAKTGASALQGMLDVIPSLDQSTKDYLQTLVDAVSQQELFADALEKTSQQMEATQQFEDAASSREKSFSDAYTQIIRETEDFNVSLISSDKKRAEKQLEIEHNRKVESIAMMEGEQSDRDLRLEAETARYEAAGKAMDRSLANTKDIGKELGLTFSSAFEDAMVSGKKFGDVLQSLAQDIEKMLLRKTVTQPLMNGVSNWFDSMDFGAMFSANAKGGVYSSPGLSAYSGQIVSSPTVFPFAKGAGLMGEAGPEAIMPLSRGADGKLGVRGVGSNTSVQVNIIGAPSTPKVQRQTDDNGNVTIDVMFERVEGWIGKRMAKGEGAIADVMQGRYGMNAGYGAQG